MEDVTAKILMTWQRYQKLAWSGQIDEPKGPFPRKSGIACPNAKKLNGDWTPCGAELIDTTAVLKCGSEPRRVVHCETCSLWFCRLLGEMGEKKTHYLFGSHSVMAWVMYLAGMFNK